MASNEAVTSGVIASSLKTIWNIDCFDGSKTKERTAIITLIVISIFALMIAIFTKSSALGTTCGVSMIIAGSLILRRIMKNREENPLPKGKANIFAEIKNVFVIPPEVTPLDKQPKCFGNALFNVNFKKINTFVETDAPASQDNMLEITQKVEELPFICYGTFKGGEHFILIKFTQRPIDESAIHCENFFLFVGSIDKEEKWKILMSSNTPKEWAIDFNYEKSDLTRLSSLLHSGQASLRGKGKKEWIAHLPDNKFVTI